MLSQDNSLDKFVLGRHRLGVGGSRLAGPLMFLTLGTDVSHVGAPRIPLPPDPVREAFESWAIDGGWPVESVECSHEEYPPICSGVSGSTILVARIYISPSGEVIVEPIRPLPPEPRSSPGGQREPAEVFVDGQDFEIGDDIVAGTYLVTPNSDECSYTITRGSELQRTGRIPRDAKRNSYSGPTV